ncbi:uncharacterized protein LOC143360367 isoform X3 [Halictus rubicundus]|uniref:uncharacterized protein LOC143360367 isoform X3 n=1 Tax=Halictus rubicundus TaxID=77578 RepID=UPI004035A7F8
MEEFRKNFSLYSSILCFTALWPYDESRLGKIQRVTLSVLYLCLLAIQISTIKWVEKSLYNVLMMLSFTCPLTLYFLRYVGFAANRSVMRAVFDKFSNDYSATTDPVELDIFTRQIIVARRVILAFVGLSLVLIAYTFVVLLVPTILRSNAQLQYLHIFGFFYPEKSRQTDCVCIFFLSVNVMGLLSVASTESAVAVSSSYLCGLLEIASYRMGIAIDNMVHSTTSQLIQVRSVVELHKRAFNTLNDILGNMVISYLIAILAVVISFAVNLYRLLLAFKNAQDFPNLFFAVNIVLLHFVIMYLNNLNGQRVIDTSKHIFNTICNSSWYCIPLRSQKMLLFMLMRSVKEMRCDLGGLYDLGYEGFSMMMSTSFSYFTVMSSTQ